jgi:hypothetical protein
VISAIYTSWIINFYVNIYMQLTFVHNERRFAHLGAYFSLFCNFIKITFPWKNATFSSFKNCEMKSKF